MVGFELICAAGLLAVVAGMGVVLGIFLVKRGLRLLKAVLLALLVVTVVNLGVAGALLALFLLR